MKIYIFLGVVIVLAINFASTIIITRPLLQSLFRSQKMLLTMLTHLFAS